MSSNLNSTLTIVQQEDKTFAVVRENVVLGQYKSKSYAMKKLKQFSESEFSHEQSEEKRIVFRNGDLSVLRAEICSEQKILDTNQLQEVISELNQLLNDYFQLPNQLDSVIRSIRSNIEFFESAHSFENELSSLVKESQAVSANIPRSARENCADGVAVDATPHSNTGGLNKEKEVGTFDFSKIDDDLPEFLKSSELFEEIKNLQISENYQQIVMENGRPKQIMLRRGLKTPAFIDTLSFTIGEAAFYRIECITEPDFSRHGELVTHKREIKGEEALVEGVVEFIKIMGLKVVGEGTGRNGYASSFLLGDKDEDRNYGFVAFGGHNQNGSVMFHLTGEGLAMARNGWELMLYSWLKKHEKVARITRVDIAHDMLFGGYTVDDALNDWARDYYTVRQTRPQCERQGVDWLSGTKKGKTLYIGSKKSSRILYFYEKGKQLGDENSEWVRIELRQRNKD